MTHTLWPGADGSEIYCDLEISSELGNRIWGVALESLKLGMPAFSKPLFVRTVIVDFAEVSQRRLVLTDDPAKAIPPDDLDRLLKNEANLRKRLGH